MGPCQTTTRRFEAMMMRKKRLFEWSRGSSDLLLTDGDKGIDLRRIRRIIRWIENKLPEVL